MDWDGKSKTKIEKAFFIILRGFNPNPFLGEQDADSEKSQKSLPPNVQYVAAQYTIRTRSIYIVQSLLLATVLFVLKLLF